MNLEDNLFSQPILSRMHSQLLLIAWVGCLPWKQSHEDDNSVSNLPWWKVFRVLTYKLSLNLLTSLSLNQSFSPKLGKNDHFVALHFSQFFSTHFCRHHRPKLLLDASSEMCYCPSKTSAKCPKSRIPVWLSALGSANCLMGTYVDSSVERNWGHETHRLEGTVVKSDLEINSKIPLSLILVFWAQFMKP